MSKKSQKKKYNSGLDVVQRSRKAPPVVFLVVL